MMYDGLVIFLIAVICFVIGCAISRLTDKDDDAKI
jgi:hypothetical protein